jgi:hypothetical protein
MRILDNEMGLENVINDYQLHIIEMKADTLHYLVTVIGNKNKKLIIYIK